MEEAGAGGLRMAGPVLELRSLHKEIPRKDREPFKIFQDINISLRDGKPYVHLHVVVSFPDGSTKGGHLIGAHISPIAEIFVVESESATAPKTTP